MRPISERRAIRDCASFNSTFSAEGEEGSLISLKQVAWPRRFSWSALKRERKVRRPGKKMMASRGEGKRRRPREEAVFALHKKGGKFFSCSVSLEKGKLVMSRDDPVNNVKEKGWAGKVNSAASFRRRKRRGSGRTALVSPVEGGGGRKKT